MSKLPTVVNQSRSLANVSPLQLYLTEIAKYPLLNPSEEFDLAVKHYEDGDLKAAHRLVTANLRLVVKIANDFRQAQVNLLDLIQEGNYGLMQAVKKFNPYKGVKLSSYAAWWIRAYILKHIMDNHSQVKIGTTAAQRKLYFNLKKEAERLLAEYDRVDSKLLAESLDVKEAEVIEMQQRLKAPDLSLDAPIGGNQDSAGPQTHGDILADQGEAIDERLARNQVTAIFSEYLDDFKKTLSGRDLEVFTERLLAEEPVTLQEIGDRYGISRERARQIEARIVKNLQKFVEAKGQIIDVDSLR